MLCHKSAPRWKFAGECEAVAVFVLACLLTLAMSPPLEAQTFTVLHTFTGGQDGSRPLTGVVVDRSGNLYGVTYLGGYSGGSCATVPKGCGVVYKLTNRHPGWIFSTLYTFKGPPDGNYPAGVVIGPDGTLYGATYGGGIVNQGSCVLGVNGCGTVFRVRPPATRCTAILCPWDETVLYAFTGENGDAGGPYNGDLLFDSAGSIYGTTEWGGAYQWGAAYKLTPSQGGWSEGVIYSFDASGPQGWGVPQTGLIMDQAGNLYGTTVWENNYADGVVYQLTAGPSGYTGSVVRASQCDANGCLPGTLTFDPAGNILSAYGGGGLYNTGTVFKLLVSQGWSLDTLFNFNPFQGGTDRVAMDSAGNLYGTTPSGGAHGYGTVFKLTPSADSTYTYTDLYDFTGGADGANPYGGVAIDANGNLYGTTNEAGNLSDCLSEFGSGCGTLWQITQ